jgi:hypothetical protein
MVGSSAKTDRSCGRCCLVAGALFLLVSLTPAAAQAGELSDLVFSTVEGEVVEITKEDGWTMEGTLKAFDATTAVLITSDGKVLSVPRSDIAAIKLAASYAPAPAAPVAPAPAAPVAPAPVAPAPAAAAPVEYAPPAPAYTPPPAPAPSRNDELLAQIEYERDAGQGRIRSGVSLLVIGGVLTPLGALGATAFQATGEEAFLALGILGLIIGGASLGLCAIPFVEGGEHFSTANDLEEQLVRAPVPIQVTGYVAYLPGSGLNGGLAIRF